MTKSVSQIFLSDDKEEFPKFIRKTSSSIKRIYSDHSYKLYGKEELRDFIKDNYESEVLWAYDVLRPFSYKSDLGRFCLLYKLGGWYFDIAVECLLRVDIENEFDMLCFRDEQRHSLTSWAVAGGIIWSKPGNEIMSTAINLIVKNCKEHWYGRTPLCPTGPSLFGEAIATKNRDKNLIFGYLDRPMIPFTKRNFPYFKKIVKAKFRLPSHKKFALLKPAAGGDLKSIGAKGSNNYNDFWHTKSVYDDIPIRPNYN